MIKYQCNINYNTFTGGGITKKKQSINGEGGSPDIKVKILSSKLLFSHLLK